MNEHLNDITLKSGERVEAVVVRGPDAAWRERINALLAHKGEVWRWQVEQLLSRETGAEARFYLLHRQGAPFCNIMTVELKGVGLLGHVWTRPDDRRQGAASALMNETMRDFSRREGQALYLGTGFDSAAFHIYRGFGFEPVEPGSGAMSFFTKPKPEFEAAWFAPGDTQCVALGWPQWSCAAALFTGDFPGVVRAAPLGLLGRVLTEGPLLPLLRRESQRAEGEREGKRAEGDAPRVRVLQKTENGAVVGLAAWDDDPLWPATCRLDVWCHPLFWERGGDLLQALGLPDARRVVAFSDATCPQKAAVLQAAGFRAAATLPQWTPADQAATQWVDVTMWEKC